MDFMICFWILVSSCVHCALTNTLYDRLDCVLVENTITQEECLKRGCIYDRINLDRAPSCYLDKKFTGYSIERLNTEDKNALTANLNLKILASKSTPFNQISKVKFEAINLSENILRIKFTDPSVKRYEVPIQADFNIPTSRPNETNFEVSLNNEFANLTVIRKSTGTKLIDTSIGGLIYSDRFIQFATYLASKDVYGLGENYHLSFKREMDYTTLPIFALGNQVGDVHTNNYGHHPYFTVLEADGKAHGFFLLNSNAMSYTLLPFPGISLKLTGGIFDLFLIVGESPEHVTQLYTSLIGRPVMPPFWALGFQNCRWGYHNLEDVKKVVKRYHDHDIPLDVQYIDLDYMDENRDFTFNLARFGDLPKYIEESKAAHNLRWTLILDPAIEADHHPYVPFEEGYKRDVFIKWSEDLRNVTSIVQPKNVLLDKGVFYGKVWPKGPVAFPDFFKNATVNWWKDMIKLMYKDLKFDALWIDMNEPANKDDSISYSKCDVDKYQFTHPQMKYTNPLNHRTICMSTIQGEHGEFAHYDVHSLYGLSETKPTLSGLREATGKRGFVVSRSTYPSSGHYAAHWLGDNAATWEQLRQSIVGMLEFSLFGIPFTGADICGFRNRPSAELCRRWYQLGAYYPFSRSHNTVNEPDQDPGHWIEHGHPEVTKSAVDALRMRYRLLHYLYTCFYRSHVYGETLVRPLHHVFPQDHTARNIDEQFFLGGSIMMNPFLYENQTLLSAYVPDDSEWFRLSKKTAFVEQAHLVSGHVHFVDTDSSQPLLFLAGSIIPIVSDHNLPKPLNTVTLRAVPIDLWIMTNSTGTAQGDLFYDDGDSIDTVHNKHYNYYQFKLANCQLSIEPIHSRILETVDHNLKIQSIHITLSVLKTIHNDNLNLEINGLGSGEEYKASVNNHELKIEFDKQLDLLLIKSKIVISFMVKSSNECFIH